MDLIPAPQRVEVTGQHTVTMEIEEAALLGQEEPEILPLGDLGDLTEELVLAVMVRLLGTPLSSLLPFDQLFLGNPEGFMNGVVQIGRLEFLLQMIRFVRNDEVLLPGMPISICTTGGIVELFCAR